MDTDSGTQGDTGEAMSSGDTDTEEGTTASEDNMPAARATRVRVLQLWTRALARIAVRKT